MQIGKNNEVYKRLKALIKANKDEDVVATTDLNVIKLALKYNLNILEFFYVNDEIYKAETNLTIEEAKKKALSIYEISKNMFESIQSKENQVGLAAIIEYKTNSLNDLRDKSFIVVLDGLEIPGNIGTILRTLDSASVDGLIIVDAVTKMHNPKITTSSRGCNLLIPTAVCSFEEAQNFLLENNYNIYLGEPNLGLDYTKYDYKGKIAIVMGNERFGINLKWYNKKHTKVFIPMYGSNNSLNVAVATSIIVYEAAMKRKITK